ncbi:MAG: hypothetical protein ACRD6X_02270 [Pyrinomonadaceae bacterium]
MMFRPKFCCNCGEKIERAEWRLWTSRRFCQLCATEHQHIDIIPIAAILLGLVLTIAGSWTLFSGSGSSNNRRSAKVESKGLKAANVYSSNAGEIISKSDESANSANDVHANTSRALPTQQINEQPSRTQKTSEETVYYCGAITKKGTPCTRRVKTKGFCWQHARTGQVAPTRF